MKRLKKKGEAKNAKFAAKIPLELNDKIDQLNKTIEAAGLELDWDYVVTVALTKACDRAEADLKEASKPAA